MEIVRYPPVENLWDSHLKIKLTDSWDEHYDETSEHWYTITDPATYYMKKLHTRVINHGNDMKTDKYSAFVIE